MTSIPHTASQRDASRGTKFDPSTAVEDDEPPSGRFDPSTARLDDERPSGPWGKNDELVSGAWGKDDELVEDPTQRAGQRRGGPRFDPSTAQLDEAAPSGPRCGGTRAETQTAIDSNNHRGTGFDDPRRLDKLHPKMPAVIADEALRSAQRSQQDPILRPEFIEQLRQDYEAMAPEDRLADLRLLAGESNVRGRAARVILRDVEAENRAVRETGADRPELTDIVMRAGQPVGGGSGARPKQTAFPEVNEVARLASGQTTDDVLQRDRAARTVFEAERSPQAVAGPTAKQVAAADRAKRDGEREGFGEGTWLQSPWDFYAGMASGAASAVRDMASLELASPDALSSPLRQQIARSVHDWAGEMALDLDATKSRAEKAKAREFQSITDDPNKGVADVLGFLFTEPLFLANKVGESVLPMIGGGLVGKGVGRLASALGASSGVAGSAAMWGAVGSEAAQIAGGVHDKAIEAGLSREEARLATGNALVLALGIGKFTGGGASGAVAQGRHGVLRTARSEAVEEGAQHFIDPLALKAAGDVPIDWQKEVKGAVGDAVIGGVMGGVTGARPGARPPTRDEQIAAAINDGVATTHFNADAIDSYARHAGSADANTPGMTRAEWTARQQGDVGPAAPVTLRMEDMPDTPFTLQDVAHLQAAADQVHAEEFAARGVEVPVAGDKPVPVATAVDVEPPTQRVIGQALESQIAGRNGAATATEVPDQGPGMDATVQNTLEGRQQVARQPQPGPTQIQPGQIARGSLAREAQQVLDSRTSQKQIDAVHPAVPVADPVLRTTGTSISSPDRLPDESSKLSAVVERPTQQPAHVSEVSKQAAPVAPAQRAQAATDRAGKQGSGQAERFPTFQNKGAALAWSVEKRRSSTIEPVKVGDTWTLQVRQVDRSQAGSASAQTAVADPTPTAGSKAMPQAAHPANMPVATHAEPGQPVEAASAPVVAASLTKAASAEGRKPSAMRADLVQKIDAAVAALPADADQRDVQLAAFARDNRRRLESNDTHVRQALAADRDRLTKGWGTHTFDAEGDGQFTVMATPGRLAAFKAKVSASAGFKAKQGVPAAPEVAGAQHGSPSVKAAIENMLDEGDVQAATDYAAAKNIDPSKMGLNPARLAKLNGVTPTPATTTTPMRSAESTTAPTSTAATAPGLQSDADAGPVQSEPGERTAQYDAGSAAVDSPARNDGDPLASTRPHEMSQADFIKAVDVARTGGSDTPWVASFDGRKIGAGFKTRREAITAAREVHGRAVQRAVRDGRPVQANVLADYPDIAPVSAAVESQTAPLAEGSKSTESRAASQADNIAPSVRRLFEAEAFRGLEVSVDVPTGDAGAVDRLIVDAAEGLALTDRRISMIEAGHPHEYDGDAIAQAARTAMSLGANATEARTKAVAEVMAMVRKEWAEMLATARATYPDKARELDAMLAEGAKSAEAGAARIEDAGQKIGGARKDRWKERGMGVADLDDMTEAEGATLVTKANTWKPEYASMVAAGARPKVAAMVKLVYDGLAAAPKENTPDGRRRYVTAMGLMREVYADMGRHQDLSPGVPASDASTMRRAAEELRQKMGVYDKDFTKVQDAKRLLFSVYKGRSDPFAAGYELERRADKLVEAGFPAKIEPWTRRFEISKAGGAGSTVAGTDAIVKRSAEYGTPVSAEQARAGVFAIINKTSRKTLAMAATRDDAQAAAQALYERELGAKGDGKVAPERPHLDTLTREGLDKRIDHDVAPDDFLQTFGFRGVEFGLWAANDERQRLLNMAFDGLHDLAEIIGVPPKALSLNGSMGMAFGARGGGRFAAHYEPGRLVINMTKLQGGGSLAHEWAHALDHYLGELDRADAYSTVARGASGWTTKRDYSGALRSRHVRDGGGWAQRKVTSLDNLRPEVGHAFNGVMRALFNKQFGQAQMVRELELDLERTQASIVAAKDDATKAMHERSLKARQQSLDETRREPDDKTYSRGGSDFAKEAQKLSGKSANGYWTRPTEMFARAFESYVFDKLLAMGAKSDYLVHGVEDERFAGGDYKGNPYPVGEERAAIDRAFDRLFGVIQTRETDKGVAMFQRAADESDQPDQAELNALQALSENDELFALPKPVGMTVEAIAAEIDPEIKVRQNSQGGGRTDYTLTMPDGNTGRLVVREPNKYGQQLYGFDLVEGEITNQAVGRPGENPEDVDPGTGDVWIDVSLLSPGTGGGQVYAIAAAYAHNTGRIFIGDPAGLSDEALRRRSEQMLSSALKFGTTEHLAPHPRQLTGDAKLGVPGLRWVYGDDLGNIRRLIDLNLKALENAGLDDTSISFDPASGQFRDSNGKALGRDGIDAGVEAGLGRGALAGGSTIARGAVWRALLREAGAEGQAGGRRDGLLARLARLAGDHGEATQGVFYSRDGVGASDALSLADVGAAADEITQAWSNAPQFVVLANMAEAPAAARRANQAQLAGGATGTPAAFLMGGKVYLVASQMRNHQAVAEAVLHEALGHAGLRGVFGSRLDAVLSELADSRPELVAAKANQYGLDTTVKAQRLQAAEEVLAELAQTQPELGLVRRAIAAIRAWLRDAMPFMRNTAMSDDEIVQRFILPARRFVVGGAGSVSEPGFAFRRGADESSPFYSALARQVRGLPMKAAPASGWQQTLKGLIGSGKVKADEVAWSGLGEWLDLQQGRVSKEQVTQYLDANGVRVEDVVMGHDQPAEITVSFDSDYDGPGQGRWVSSAGGKEVGSGMTLELAQEDADEVRNDPEQSVIYNGSTSYGGFVLPGGKAYREMLLTLPGPVQYQSRHWPGHSNVLAHVRFNEHADAQGRRVLMIEELQSDWALALRRQERGQLKDDEGGDQAPAPAAPFVGKADAWVALALKRLIRYASDNGFERVAFVTGKQAHKRFSDNLGGDAALASTSALYGEADGSVRGNRGRSTGKTPILHSVAKDVLRKLGGAGLLKMQIIGKGRTMLDQVGFDITPELREKVAGGVPMFARADKAGASYASFKQWLENNPERDYSKLQLVNAGARFEQSPVTEVAANESGKRPTLRADIDPESDEFKTWFAGSELVDDKGEPMPLYGRANESGRYPPSPSLSPFRPFLSLAPRKSLSALGFAAEANCSAIIVSSC